MNIKRAIVYLFYLALPCFCAGNSSYDGMNAQQIIAAIPTLKGHDLSVAYVELARLAYQKGGSTPIDIAAAISYYKEAINPRDNSLVLMSGRIELASLLLRAGQVD